MDVRRRATVSQLTVLLSLVSPAAPALAEELLGEGPGLRAEDRVTQDQIIYKEKSLREIRAAGLAVFVTPFNKHDGYGDGPHDPGIFDQRSPAAGNRPTLQGNGSFLRVNGLDAQTCLECHTIVSNRTVPATLGIGGVGGVNTNAMFQPEQMNVVDTDFDGHAEFDGRLINPPFLFGVGGVELVAREMTRDLQNLRKYALLNPGASVELETKGVSFGSITADEHGTIDTRNIEGIDDDLVVRPFGSKGDVASLRAFDVDAMSFHLGMQASERFGGPGADADNDGVRNEISMGDLTALSVFLSTLERPQQKSRPQHQQGAALFREIGCTECHIPALDTAQTHLPLTLTGAPDRPFEDVFYEVDLTQPPVSFERNSLGGIKVPLFSDLKRHDMGEALAETFSLASARQNREFITAKLWGVADTAPYMHDGRAFTLIEAIRMHDNPGSEASAAARNFEGLATEQKNDILRFLLSLRTPADPARDLLTSQGDPRDATR